MRVEGRREAAIAARLVAAVMPVVLVVLAAAPAAPARTAGRGADGRPNILVIMTDDQTVADLRHMPNVRRLIGGRGATFTDAIASFPLCCPARATFLTGQYAHNHRVTGQFHPKGWYGMPGRANTLPVWLRRAGYRTAFVGKWLNGYGARTGRGEVPPGWDLWRGLLDLSAYDYFNFLMSVDGRTKAYGDRDFARRLVRFGKIQTVPRPEPVILTVYRRLAEVFGPGPYRSWGTADPEAYTTDVTGRATADIIARERSSKRPFFVWWSPAAPHREDVAATLMGRPGPDPRPAPRHAARSRTFRLPRPPSFNQDAASFAKLPSNMQRHLKPLTEADIAELERDYQGRIGSLLAVDEHVRRLVATLRRTGQERNTLILFTSDNGWLHGEHRVPGDKFLPYEESLRVPLLLAGPGVARRRTVGGQVADIDLAPTILAAARARAGRTQDGVSLLPAARDPRRRPRRAIAIQAPRPLFDSPTMPQQWDQAYRGVRTDRWKYVVYRATGEEELYDLRRDRHELNNLAADPAHGAVKSALAAKLRRLERCRGRACDVAP